MSEFGILHDGVLSVSPREAHMLSIQGAAVVDLRHKDYSDFKAFDLERVYYFSPQQLREQYSKLPDKCFLILADSAGLKSNEMVRFLMQKGFSQVAELAGGFVEWERDGMPILLDINERLSGACACQLKPREKR
jgi:rhodanese-related sulfurtransferase